MKVVCPYIPGGLHKLTRESLNKYAPDAEFYELGLHRDAYYTLFRQLWETGEGWLNVEQDNEIRSDVVLQAETCPEPWCAWEYKGANGGSFAALGCTRFSTELLQEYPDFMANLGIYNWQIMDAEIKGRLCGLLGHEAHIHEPMVDHHHYYVGWGCACEKVH